jgi:hypothetical protein
MLGKPPSPKAVQKPVLKKGLKPSDADPIAFFQLGHAWTERGIRALPQASFASRPLTGPTCQY